MAVRLMVQRMVRLLAVVLVLSCCAGCRVIQNRYAVFGFDGLQTEYAEEARAWSLALLGGIAIISGAVGATGIWLGPRLYRGWREGFVAESAWPRGGQVGRERCTKLERCIMPRRPLL